MGEALSLLSFTSSTDPRYISTILGYYYIP
ncbi:hypothetical protein V1478_000575 [Vespula squamosa]|uniref:Uncharacterized protein n=1 Tax=Vespula squamosa TaxID=30214 RepID=A0ABD2C607_VESSQ